MLNLTALLSGLVFGFGLILGGMTNPSKVIGFLDVAGLWDPSLALVMGGAIAVASVAFAVAGRRARSLLAWKPLRARVSQSVSQSRLPRIRG